MMISRESQMLDNIEDRLFSFDTNMKLFTANRPMIEDFKVAFDRELKPGVSVLENVPEPVYSDWLARYQRVLKGESFDMIDQFLIGGVPEYVKLSYKPLYEDSKIIGGSCHSRDITRQYLAEQENKNNALHLNAQINNTNESIWSVDREYRILTTNNVFRDNFEQIFGHRLEKGDRVLDFIPKDLRQEWKNRYDKVLGGKRFVVTDKFEFGEFLQFTDVAFNPIVVNNEVVGFAGFTKDITDLVLKQKELEQALEKAKESDKIKSAFVANISHEIRSPLNSILGFAELGFEEDFTTEQKNSFRDTMLRSGSHLMDVIDGIIDISIIESGQLAIEKTNFSLNELLAECVGVVKTTRKDNLTSMHLEPAPDLKIYSDEKRVRQVLINLLTNALKFTPRGAIEVGVVNYDSNVEIYVSDSGTGISPEVGEKLFDRFYRATDNKEVAAGTGLGLAISKALVEAMGGTINYTSVLGEGSRFYFTLPK